MKSIDPPETIKLYQLLKMSGTYISGVSSPVPSTLSSGLGIGFFLTLQEAEHVRTLEILKDTSAPGTVKPTWHIFELEFPNPALNL
jgi:hypothetical protein